jgi:D-alanyl-D-alanine carboxypeptidase
VMQLAAEGTLSLDDPLSAWLPDYAHHNGATLRQLLAHTSGIFNYFEHPSYSARVFGQPDHSWTPSEIVRDFAAAPYFPAGTRYHYSNTGFVLLGMVIEQATGNSLDAELRSRLFEPLGMGDTFFQGEQAPPARAAHGYLVGRTGNARLINDGTDYRPTTSAATVAWAAGSIAASGADLAVWARALYDGSVVEPEYLAQMTDFSANPYSGLAYGLGTRTRWLHGYQAVGHTGSLRGFAAAMWHFPDQDITVVVLSNRGRVDVLPVADALTREAMEAVGYLP